MSAQLSSDVFPTVDKCLARALEYIQVHEWTHAERACKSALAIDPNHAEAYHLLGHVAGQMGQSDLAIAHLHKAVALNPRHPQYRYNLAVSLGLLGQGNEAAIQYQACLRQNPNHLDALWNYGEMLRMAEHFDLAAVLFERFEARGGQYPALHHRLGVTYSALHRDAEAEAHFQQELNASDQPDLLTSWEYSLFLLSRERFSEGFAHYKRRFLAGGRNSVFCHPFMQPLWSGVFTTGSTLLIHGEQGLGDEMMFASILPEVLKSAQQSQSRVILAVKPGLVRLFTASFPSAIVRPHIVGGSVVDLVGLGKIDWQLPMGDLPVLFRRSLEDFEPARHPYLFADTQRSSWYASQLDLLEPHQTTVSPGSPVLKVGIMWGSNPAAVNAKFMRWSQQRSIPVHMFERLAHLLPDVRFVSLQNSERGHEAALAPALDIFDLSSQQTDFYETAALIANLDIVISVDTSISHLAGAMGKETWVPLIHHSDWRHGHHRTSSYWYQKTRYFHQSNKGDWAPVIEALANALQERLAQSVHRILPVPSTRPELGAINERQDNEDLSQAVHWLALRELDKARPYFEKALAASPHSRRVQWEYAMQLLTEGQWAQGWDFHEARHSIFGWSGLNLCPLEWPVWMGEPLEGKTLVVHGEQGVGDEIMYASMIPDLVARGAKVVLACVPPLVAIFQYAFPSVRVIPHPRGSPQSWRHSLPEWTRSEFKEFGSADYQIAMGSLGQYLRRSETDFPRQPYLKADPLRVAKMAARLKDAQPMSASTNRHSPILRVGLAWCGSLGDSNARARSISLDKLQEFERLGNLPGVQLVSLQSRQYASQAKEFPQIPLIDMSEYTDDFADLAALMVNLDLIISVDTSYGHLAGALGLPVWRMVTRTCDWRWGWERDDSVWYPHDRLFRQKTDGDWRHVINEVASEFTNLYSHKQQDKR